MQEVLITVHCPSTRLPGHKTEWFCKLAMFTRKHNTGGIMVRAFFPYVVPEEITRMKNTVKLIVAKGRYGLNCPG